MDRGTWQATIHEVTRVRHDLLTKPPQIMKQDYLYHNYKITVNLNGVSRVCVHVKSFQLCLTLCNSMNYSPEGGGGLVAKSCPTLATPWTVACQAPLSMRFSRQEYWSGLPFPSPGGLPDPGIEPRSPALQQILSQLSYNGSP